MERQLKWFSFIAIKIFSNCFKLKSSLTQNHNEIAHHTYQDGVGEDGEKLEPFAHGWGCKRT